ncbi:MAG TPA: CHAD domain-containing protein [Vicinamibacterales bacterium]|nr:CHAD domain-containing protein [Vicinamibacterales bacterium]
MAVTVGRSELLIRQRLSALARMLPGARAGDVNAIHQARVATRRLREALPLVARGEAARKTRRAVRRLNRSLGPVRELDVALLTLHELTGTRDVPRAGIVALQQAIRQERARMHRDMRRTIDESDLDKTSRKLVRAAKKHDALGASARAVNSRQLVVARVRAARRAGRLAASIENAAAIYLPDRLHEVRIAVKKLRYAMEIVRELSGSRATVRIRTLKRAQDLLGRIHDLEVLIARTRAIQGSPNAPTLRVSAEMDLLVRRLETECRRLHGRYITMRASLLSICDYATAIRPTGRREPAA